MKTIGGKKEINLFLLPAIIYLIIFTIYPTIYTWYISFRNYSFGENSFVGLKNYQSLIFSDEVFLTSLYNTFFYVVLAVAVEFILGLAIAILFNKDIKGKSLALVFLMLPMIIPPVVSALTFLMMYDPTLGLPSYILKTLFSIQGPSLLTDPRWAKLAVIFIDIWQWTPFMVIMLLAGMQYIPTTVKEAAKVDGANSIQSFFHIILPLMKRIIILAIIFRAMDAFKAFESIFITTRGGPGYTTQTMNIYNYLISFNYLKFGRAGALSIILLLIVSLFITVLVKFLRSE